MFPLIVVQIKYRFDFMHHNSHIQRGNWKIQIQKAIIYISERIYRSFC